MNISTNFNRNNLLQFSGRIFLFPVERPNVSNIAFGIILFLMILFLVVFHFYRQFHEQLHRFINLRRQVRSTKHKFSFSKII